MKISIITVCFNSERYIRQTIESVVGQDYENIEYIVIDGASTDGTCAIIDEYRDKIAYFISERDKNMYDAINKGMRVATGDYIAILNSDDFYCAPNVISCVVKALKPLDTSKYLGVYGDLKNVDAIGEKARLRRGLQVSFESLLASRQLTFVGHGTVFLHRRVLEHVGFYADQEFSAACDYDYILRCFNVAPLKHINVSVMCFRRHSESITSSGRIREEIQRVLARNGYRHRYILFYVLWGWWIVKNITHISWQKRFRR